MSDFKPFDIEFSRVDFVSVIINLAGRSVSVVKERGLRNGDVSPPAPAPISALTLSLNWHTVNYGLKNKITEVTPKLIA